MSEEEAIPYEVQYLDGPGEASPWISRAGKAGVKYSNGDAYQGLFNAAGQKHGKGVYTWKTEEGIAKYEGSYVNGVRQGFGIVRLPNNDEYRGLWARDKRNGQGTYTYANGDKFSGSWENDQKHGHGAYVFKNKSQITGEWNRGVLVRGKWIMSDYSCYHGTFISGKPIGEGVFIHNNGQIQLGEFLEESKEEDVETEEQAARRFVSREVYELKRNPKDYMQLSTSLNSDIPTGDFILPIPKEKSPLLKEQEELALLYSHLINAKSSVELESNDNEDGEDNEGEEGIDGEEKTEEGSEGKEAESKDETIEGEGEVNTGQDNIDESENAESKEEEESPKVSIQEMVNILQASQDEEEGKFKQILSSAPAFASGELLAFVNELDSDDNGLIEEEELKTFFYLVKLFHLCDTDKSGEIKHSELFVAMRDHPDRFPPGFVDGDATRVGVSAKLSTGDVDHDRLLTFAEFARMTMGTNQQQEGESEEKEGREDNCQEATEESKSNEEEGEQGEQPAADA